MRIISAVALALSLTACGGGGEDEPAKSKPAPPSLAEVSETCQPQNERARFEVESAKLSLSIVPPVSTEDEQRLGAVVSCVVDELGGPSTVTTLVGGTTGKSGAQKASWDGFAAEWVFDASSVGLVFLVKPS